MKKDIESRPIDWIKPAPANPPAEPIEPPTGYGILKPVQSALAAIRTDLDSFSDAEAFALMNSGYQMTAEAFPLANPDFPVADGPPFDWKFLKVKDIAPAMRDPDKHAPLQRLLEVGASRAFKVWKLVPALKYASWALGAAGLAGAGWLTWRNWNETLLTVEDVAVLVIGLVLSTAVLKAVWSALRFGDTLMKIVLYGVLAAAGWIGALVHLKLFDRWFLKRGRLEAILPNDRARQTPAE